MDHLKLIPLYFHLNFKKMFYSPKEVLFTSSTSPAGLFLSLPLHNLICILCGSLLFAGKLPFFFSNEIILMPFTCFKLLTTFNYILEAQLFYNLLLKIRYYFLYVKRTEILPNWRPPALLGHKERESFMNLTKNNNLTG